MASDADRERAVESLAKALWRAQEEDASPAPLGWDEPDAGQTAEDVRRRQEWYRRMARTLLGWADAYAESARSRERR